MTQLDTGRDRSTVAVRYFGVHLEIRQRPAAAGSGGAAGRGLRAVDTGDTRADLRFRAGPHALSPRAVDGAAAPWQVDVAGTGAGRRYEVRRAGITRLQRSFRRWDDLGAPVPPLALFAARVAVVPAVVVARGAAVLAVQAGPEAAAVGLGLVEQGWSLVAGRTLVVDRDSGATLPCLAPLRFRGDDVARLDVTGLDHRRSTGSLLGEPVLDLWPSGPAAAVSIDDRLAPATLVRVCRSGRGERLVHGAGAAPVAWQVEAGAAVERLHRCTVQLPRQACAYEVAALLEQTFGRSLACPDVPAIHTELPAGLTA